MVVCSDGNEGLVDVTLQNAAPWQIVVGASTMNRDFPNYVVLGNNKRFKVNIYFCSLSLSFNVFRA